MHRAINFKENPVDIPNPDRGYYRPHSYVLPVEEGEMPDMPDLSTTIIGTTVSVDSRIVYMEIDMRNFSSNAPLDGLPAGRWGKNTPNYGKTQPLTAAALDYLGAAFDQIRDSEAVCIVKFSYDGQGYTYNNRGRYNVFLHDCEPGAPKGREWYETGGRKGGKVNNSDLCGIPGHEDKNWVQYHLWQLGSVFSEYEDIIMAVKAGIFGPWGEMHSSTYGTSAKAFHWLLNALLDYVPASRSILVHPGGAMAWYNIEYNTKHNFENPMPVPEIGSKAQRFGTFNDSYSMGSEDFTDQSSLSEGIQFLRGKFNRNSALTWIRNQNNFYGGETNTIGQTDGTSNVYPTFPNVPYEAAIARTSHLNADWAPGMNCLWDDFIYNEANITAPFTPPHDGVTRKAVFDPVYDGRNGMVFMRDRLGYRLVLREACIDESVAKDGVLEFNGKIQNVGFGNIINKKRVTLILHPKSEPEGGHPDDEDDFALEVDLDPRDWRAADDGNNRPDNISAWRDISFKVNMTDFGDVPAGEYFIYLKINDPKETSENRRCIQFANYDIWNIALGANLLGLMAVV